VAGPAREKGLPRYYCKSLMVFDLAEVPGRKERAVEQSSGIRRTPAFLPPLFFVNHSEGAARVEFPAK
jgi:hypothetical protein